MSVDEFDAATLTLALSGPITLYESVDVRETLITALSQGKNLAIDLATSGPWDLAGLQLLVSVAATGRKSGLGVKFLNVPRVCREIAERSGLGDWLAEVAESYH